jgi:hypothetical protein
MVFVLIYHIVRLTLHQLYIVLHPHAVYLLKAYLYNCSYSTVVGKTVISCLSWFFHHRHPRDPYQVTSTTWCLLLPVCKGLTVNPALMQVRYYLGSYPGWNGNTCSVGNRIWKLESSPQMGSSLLLTAAELRLGGVGYHRQLLFLVCIFYSGNCSFLITPYRSFWCNWNSQCPIPLRSVACSSTVYSWI